MTDKKKLIVGGIFIALLSSALTVFALAMIFAGALAVNYKHMGTLSEVLGYIKNDYIYKVNTTKLVDGAISGVVDSLHDPYSVYMNPKMYKELTEHIRGSFGGVGLIVEKPENKHLVVVKPIKGTPADKKGIKKGDIITKINGKDALKMDLDTAVSLMRGKPGTKVNLEVFREAESKTLKFELVREVIEIPSVEGEMVKDTDIGHIVLSSFNTNSPVELRKTIADLKKKGMKKIIMDLRGNPGGDLQAAVEITDMFIPKGPIVFIDYRSQADEYHESDSDYLKMPLVVLVNGDSASASEIFAGAIKDTKVGIIVGTRTFGKGVVQSIYELRNGAGLKLTTAKYLTPKKRDIHKKGIQPDIVVNQPDNSPQDLQLEKAISILQQKK